jgi:hypothetical protein
MPSNQEIENPLGEEGAGVAYQARHVSFNRRFVKPNKLSPTLVCCHMSPKEKPNLHPGLTHPASPKLARLEGDIIHTESKPSSCRLPWN